MSSCPVCLEPIDVKGRVVHRCSPRPDLPPPPRPEQTGFVPPSQGSRAPLFVALGVLGLAAVAAVVLLVSGGGDGEVTAAPTTESAPVTTVTETTVAETIAPTTVAETVPATTVIETVPPPPVPSGPPSEYAIVDTGCRGTTTTNTVPAVFLDSLLARGEPFSCVFAGRWMFAVWTNSTTAEQEGAVFNIDEPIELGRPMPLLLATPSGCILDVVLDPATAIALSEGLPQGECPRA